MSFYSFYAFARNSLGSNLDCAARCLEWVHDSSCFHDGLLNPLVWIVKTTIILRLKSVAVRDLRSGSDMQKCWSYWSSKYQNHTGIFVERTSCMFPLSQCRVRSPRFSGSSASCGPSSESSACSQCISNKLPKGRWLISHPTLGWTAMDRYGQLRAYAPRQEGNRRNGMTCSPF